MTMLIVFGAFVLLLAVSAVRRKGRARKARALVAAGAVLVDVRTAEEFRAGHLPGAVNVPVDRLGRQPRELPGKEQALVVYCRSGARSARAAAELRSQGYQTVLDLGPMSAW